jgi:hypothetical protein
MGFADIASDLPQINRRRIGAWPRQPGSNFRTVIPHRTQRRALNNAMRALTARNPAPMLAP